jgi:putative hydrolase of the HAD superfamily
MQRPTAVLFDLGGTLLGEVSFDLAAGFRAVIPHAPARAAELGAAFLAEMTEVRADGRELPVARWLRARLDPGESARFLDDAEIEDRVRDGVGHLAPLPGVGAALARLADDGARMAVVSNSIFSAGALVRELARHGLASRFAFAVSSADVGVRKPAAAMFEAALSRLGAPATGETWFVGDTFADDMVGAARLGLAPVWLAGGAHETPPQPPVTRVRSWPDFLRVYESAASPPAQPPPSA